MKRITFLGLLLFCTAFVYAQEAMVLDDAIQDSVNFFSSRLRPGSTVAVTNFEAETKELSDFIIQELLVAFSNTGNVRVVDRSRLEELQSELKFNMTSSVSDETAQRIGRFVGAQILFSGSISQYRDMYRIRVQAILVETAEIIGIRTLNVKYDPTLTGLLGRINPADAWKYQWLYAGFNVGYSIQLNRDDSRDYYVDIPFGFSINARVQPFDLFGIALDFSGDLFDGPNVFIVPTLTIRPSLFEIDLFLGVGINLFYGGVAFTGGGRVGYKLGPGVLFFEVRPHVAIIRGDGTITWTQNEGHLIGSINEDYIPFNITFGLGYQIGFIPRKK
ncbi:MAG: penicillin-binding protein activator LpoB [Treponema sp.]|nr:penicillin-binding protein activator LpoB [Treponema sp.]